MRRVCLIALALHALLLFPAVCPASGDRAFLEKHCVECHDAETKKGDLDLTELKLDLAQPLNFLDWARVHDRVKAGEMPPPKKLRPAAGELEDFLGGLRTQLVEAEARRQAVEGRTELRRLNRVEYENTLRDLLKLPALAVKDILPADGEAFGFAKASVALDFSHVQVGRFMEAADVALRAAMAPTFDPPPREKLRVLSREMNLLLVQIQQKKAVPLVQGKLDPTWKVQTGNFKERQQGWTYDPPPHFDAVGTFMNRSERINGLMARYTGWHFLRVRAFGIRWNFGRVEPGTQPEAVSLYTDAGLLGTLEVPANAPTTREMNVWLNAGDRISFSVASAWHHNFNRIATGGKGRESRFEGNGVGLEWIEMEGPIYEQWPPASHEVLFGDVKMSRAPDTEEIQKARAERLRAGPRQRSNDKSSMERFVKPLPPDPHHILNPRVFPQDGPVPKTPRDYTIQVPEPEAKARQLLQRFADRAFHQAIAGADLEIAMTAVRSQLQRGGDFVEALLDGYRALLCSPDFLTIRESVGALNDRALAGRLSRFLINSGPDDELRALGDQGKLRDADALRQQTERLLNDPRSKRFHEHFLDYWLRLKDITLTEPDEKLYPEFSQLLLESMMKESRGYFAEMLRRDLGARHVVASDFAMLNLPLAKLYGVRGAAGYDVAPVNLPQGSHRGGFITQASVLKVTANGTTTSPVTRGTWLLTHILGTPPPPPPPSVPAIEPDLGGVTTIREQLAKHREMESCAACHKLIDPPGFAFENFDVMGGWRESYRAIDKGEPATGSKDGQALEYKIALPVEAASETKDGAKFANIDEYRALLLKDEEIIARNLLSQLVIYATGADVGFADGAKLDDMMSRLKARGYGVRSMIHEVVQSPLFRNK
jgi:Protein of unknown function (DUF1592)/Protein of unknown function (DUF1588)/Protein of unknown function (DUF1585)/Protein of unknown function (DUF1587)/Protein of unknown function (DUF1595)/Planctomycete cytochrome C